MLVTTPSRQRRPAARGGTTRDGRLVPLVDGSSLVGPPLAAGLRCRPVTGSQQTACYPAYRLFSQLADKLAEDMDMVIDILPGVLDRDSPLVIEARREKDTAIRQEEPVGVGETHVDVPPGAIVVRALVAEHGTAFRADLRHMHGHAELVDDADIGLRQLPGKVDGMVMRVLRENLRERHQPGAHGHRVAVEGAEMQHFLVVDMAHDLLTPAKGADGHATADGFGEAD